MKVHPVFFHQASVLCCTYKEMRQSQQSLLPSSAVTFHAASEQGTETLKSHAFCK